MTSALAQALLAFNTAVSLMVLVFVGKLAYHAGRFVQRFENLEDDVSKLVAAGACGEDADD